tara:strand:- start:503 stop:661 length:159 start_codon:yes stop_codon:yes gene_type:complete
MEEDLEHWQEIKSQREEDLRLEMLRDEDEHLINLLKESLCEAELKIEELTDV